MKILSHIVSCLVQKSYGFCSPFFPLFNLHYWPVWVTAMIPNHEWPFLNRTDIAHSFVYIDDDVPFCWSISNSLSTEGVQIGPSTGYLASKFKYPRTVKTVAYATRSVLQPMTKMIRHRLPSIWWRKQILQAEFLFHSFFPSFDSLSLLPLKTMTNTTAD